MWRPAVLVSIAASVAAGVAMLFAPLAPISRFANPRYGATELLSHRFDAQFRLQAPEARRVHVTLRARSMGAAPAGGRVTVSARGGATTEARGTFTVPNAAAFAPVPVWWDGSGDVLALPAESALVIRIESDSEGLLLDRLELEPADGAGGSVALEAEDSVLSPSTLIGFDAAASKGFWAGTLASRGDLASERLVQSFRAQANGLEGLIVNLSSAPGDASLVRLYVADPIAGRVLWETQTAAGAFAAHPGAYGIRFPAIRGSAGRTFELGIEQPRSHPVQVALAVPGTYPEGSLTWNGIRLESSLILGFRYRSLWTVLPPFLALGILVLLAVGFRSRELGFSVAAPIALMVACLGVAYWQRDYQFSHPDNWMPDGYDVFTTRVRDCLSQPGHAAFQRLETFLRAYPHAHSPLVPFLIALGTFPPLSLVQSYLAVTLLASLASGLFLLVLLGELPDVPWRVTWALWGIAVAHFLFLRAAVRTNTDAVGYTFVVLGLVLLMRIIRQPSIRLESAALLAAAVAVGAFARPTVLPLGPALAIALWACRRERAERRRVLVASGLIGIGPPLVFFGSVWAAGYFGSFALAAEKMRAFADARTPVRLGICLAVLVQLLAVPLLVGLREARRNPAWIAGACWVAFSLGFVGTVATFWSRHFLHALPGLLLMAAPGAVRLGRRSPVSLAFLAYASVALNLMWTLYLLHRGFGVRWPALVD